MPVTMSVHVFPDTPVRVRLHPEDDRVVLICGDAPGFSTVLHVYLRRAELLALRDTLTAAVVDLDTARNTTLAATGDNSIRDGGAAGAPAEVRHPAA
jgi:hypothetical protein